VLWQRGRLEVARSSLETVIAASSDGAVLYLARLFLGRVHQDAGRAREAEQQYRAALGIAPGAQTPSIALAHLLRARDDETGAHAAILRALASTGIGPDYDPFWEYPWGWSGQAERRLADLIAEATP
jgi:Flp pilus assembly protein TadD